MKKIGIFFELHIHPKSFLFLKLFLESMIYTSFSINCNVVITENPRRLLLNPLTTYRFILVVFSRMVGLSVTTPSTSRHSREGPHEWQKGKVEQLVNHYSLHVVGNVTTVVEVEASVLKQK